MSFDVGSMLAWCWA